MRKDTQPNQLFAEQSPYLLQHAYNPVNWYPWGEKALQKAAEENKMLIISVGYAACHWCHVMEKESFEDIRVADLMNQHFVSIKVDREERPDIDDIYMNACHLSGRRSCGWPLNAFALPDGRPFWASTYFPKEQWLDILRQIVGIRQNEPEKLIVAAEEIMKGINQLSLIPHQEEKTGISKEFLENACKSILAQQDFELGGRRGQPKFPMPVIYQFLLQYHQYFNEPLALNAVVATLDNMMMGGIYDQLGGGFARYSVDSYWFAPHFEKMLYDNAQLVSLYAQMHRFSKKEEYKKVVLETLAFAEREWLTPEGIFYSALDADSEGEEGRFYVWKAEEIRQAFNNPQDTALFFDYFRIIEEGNWESNYNILYRKAENHTIEKRYGHTRNELENKIDKLKSILFAVRSRRIRPLLDHKMLTSWNGLMLKAFTDAYKAFHLADYKNNAIRMASFMLENAMDKHYRLFRTFGRKKINGFLDDYANLISGLIGLYEISFDERWIFTAKNLTDYVLEHFYG
ncbi:MAG TPA: thioredoxin domain-containing protein, partial [Saprospirales bacterium]|nr:thioredoxin domain-containing protein [Saprospirales bacterium]